MIFDSNSMWKELKELSLYQPQPKELVINELKPLIDSASYLIRQVEICDHELYKLNHLPRLFKERMSEEISDWNRQRSQYMRSLNHVILKICETKN